MHKTIRFTLALFVPLILSCGGGGGGGGGGPTGETTPKSFSGVAIDGALYRATAFLDLNGNGQLDSGEPSSITDASGTYTLSATQDQINSHSVVVSAIAGTTIDQDTPNTPMTTGMTMMAPPGLSSVVSPLTTQVVAKMAGGLSIEEAKTAVKTELGLTSIDVMKNYVAEKTTNPAYAEAHKIAATVAEVMKTVDAASNTNTTLSERLKSITGKVTTQVAPNLGQIKSSASLADAKIVVITVINNYAASNVFNLAGLITGLTSNGLVLSNGPDNVSPSANATSFLFKNKIANSYVYEVKIKSQPTGQACAITNGFGSVNNQSVTNVSVTCVDSPGSLSGTVTGLTTSGLVLRNGSEDINVTAGASSFVFQNSVISGAAYSVTVRSQPTGKTCSVSNGSGTMVSAGKSDVQVNCSSSSSYIVSGSISGLSVSGLKLSNGSEIKTIASNATTFEFSNTVPFGGGYSVTVDTQPTGHTCSLSNSSGTMGAANVTSVQVACSINSYTLSGTISNLSTYGLKLKNGSETLIITSGASGFTFANPVAFGGEYSVYIDTQPSGNTCSITNGSGTMSASNYSSVSVSCSSSLTPAITLAPPANPQPTRTVLSFSAQINKNGTGYWVVTQLAQTPTAAQIISGKDASGQTAEMYGNSSMLAGVTSSFTASPLQYNTAYRLFFVASGSNSSSTASDVKESSFNSAPVILTSISTPGGYQTMFTTDPSDSNGRYYVRSGAKITSYIGQLNVANSAVDYVGSTSGTPLDGLGIQAVFNTINKICYHASSNSLFVLDGVNANQTLLLRKVNLTNSQVTTLQTFSLPSYGSYGSNISYFSNSIACAEKMLFLGIGKKLVRYDIQSQNLTTIADLFGANSVDLNVAILSSDSTTLYVSSPRGWFTIQIP